MGCKGTSTRPGSLNFEMFRACSSHIKGPKSIENSIPVRFFSTVFFLTLNYCNTNALSPLDGTQALSSTQFTVKAAKKNISIIYIPLRDSCDGFLHSSAVHSHIMVNLLHLFVQDSPDSSGPESYFVTLRITPI